MKSTILYALASALLSAASCPKPTYLGKIPVKNAAFLDVLPNDQSGNDLYITTFSGAPFSKGTIKRVENINTMLKSLGSAPVNTVDGDVTWPNGVKSIDPSVKIAGAPHKYRVISCGGFLVPSHGDGSCIVYDFNDETGAVTSLTLAKAGRSKFFHHAEFYDVDGDGFEDLVVAKANKGFFGSGSGALFWYKNPGSKSSFRRGGYSTWKEYKMFDGPDVIFKMKDLDYDGIPEIIATQFFTEKLTVNWVKPGGSFKSGPWEQRVIEGTDKWGGLFNMSMVDIDLDGDEEIVLTNHVTDGDLAGVYSVKIPKDFKKGKYELNLMVNGFPTLNSGPGQGSPGGAVPFTLEEQKYPLFAVAGDGNQRAYIMCRTGSNWEKTQILDTKNTVGAIAISDVTGNGRPEIFVPSYEKGEVHVYTYDK